jgi:hypothetical protein
MLAALILLAQVAAKTPVATPTPAPVVKADTGQTRTLADVARERKLGKKGVQGGTLSVAGAPVQGGSAASATAYSAGVAEEAVWIQRAVSARAELSAAQAALARADASLPAAAAMGWGARASAAMQYQVREAALLPYRDRVASAQARVNAVSEEARNAGAAPGWIRQQPGESVYVGHTQSAAEVERQLNNGDAPLPNRDRDIMPDGTGGK